MSTEDFDTSALEDFEAEDDFESDFVWPWGQTQHWVVFGDATADELGVYSFIMAHVNPHTGKLTARFGRKRIAERFGKSLDWVDKRLKALAEKDAMQKKPMYWRDAKDHSRGRSVNPTDSYGNKRAQAPNRYRVRIAPPKGQSHPGPISVGEFYKPSKMAARLESQRRSDDESETPGEGGAANQRPGSDQEELSADESTEAPEEEPAPDQGESGETPGEQGGRHTAAPGGRHTTAEGGPPHSGPKYNGAGRTTTSGTTTGVSTTANVSLRSDVLANDTAGRSAQSNTDQSNQVSNHPHAREDDRGSAGPKSAREEAMDHMRSVLGRRQPV
ncbi:hypothetical protein FB384_004941 [Prauserella sediminis]|uniref:Uncharacterized protein n=1 Tax=Prauserella sediminis TaxID=577680 RepID=A0A839XQ89_9PSEU|nr:hypothetical protein [Prauserella sediminis]MBB3665982.1 hypothetical protein [Prauserella sediminis]